MEDENKEVVIELGVLQELLQASKDDAAYYHQMSEYLNTAYQNLSDEYVLLERSNLILVVTAVIAIIAAVTGWLR